MKKLLSIFLAVCLIVGSVPAYVSATEMPTEITINYDGTEFTGDGKGYAWIVPTADIISISGSAEGSEITFTFTGQPVDKNLNIWSGATLKGGTFNANVLNHNGTINDGVFSDAVNNINNSTINGGYFSKAITGGGTIATDGNVKYLADLSGLTNITVGGPVENDGKSYIEYKVTDGSSNATLTLTAAEDYALPKTVKVNGNDVDVAEDGTITVDSSAPLTISGEAVYNIKDITINYDGAKFTGDKKGIEWSLNIDDSVVIGTFTGSSDYTFTFTGQPVNKFLNIWSGATLKGGIFSANILNHNGTINDGVFTSSVANDQDGIINGGVFSGTVNNQYNSTINDGVFTGMVVNDENGIINDGVFSDAVNNINNSTINGGYFSKAITGGGTIATDGNVKYLADISGLTNITVDGLVENDGKSYIEYKVTDGSSNATLTLTAAEDYILPKTVKVNGNDVAVAEDGTITVDSSAPLTISGEAVTPPAPTPTTKIGVDIPKILKTTYTYTGDEIQAEFDDYDKNIVEITGDRQREIGTYKVVIALKDTEKYQWNTETNKDGKWEYTWSIVENKPTTELVDPITGIKIIGLDTTTFNPVTELKATLEPSSNYGTYKEKIQKLSAGKEVAVLYNIKMLVNGNEVQPSGKIRIEIPLTAEQLAYENPQAIYVDNDGNVSLVSGKVENGKLIIETDHLSFYGGIGTKKTAPGSTPTATSTPTGTPNPTTGDNNTGTVVAIAVAALALLLAAVLLIYKKRCNK